MQYQIKLLVNDSEEYLDFISLDAVKIESETTKTSDYLEAINLFEDVLTFDYGITAMQLIELDPNTNSQTVLKRRIKKC